MIPWIHLHTTPTGKAAACCISNPDIDFGNSNKDGLMELVNSSEMKGIRRDMLNGIKSQHCTTCHRHEEHNLGSFRETSNREFKQHFDSCMSATEPDGTLKEFNMRYFDIRFSNICNFKCRTCNQDYSSQWEMENKKQKIYFPPVTKNNSNKDFLNEVLAHVPTMETAYFAGGEPLITEEHYILLDEMIRVGKTDISLRYNTNLSNLKFKDRDLLQLWSHFTKPVAISASLDHFGKRAEYIRHGTDWGVVETNFMNLKKVPYITMTINTVLSVYNFMTLDLFYNYLFEKGMYDHTGLTNQIYKMDGPAHLSSFILPEKYKDQGAERLSKLINTMGTLGFSEHTQNEVGSIIPWVKSKNLWEQHKNLFKAETTRIDKLRSENFVATFPEIADLMFI
jgi:hypothetical protein